MRQQHNKSLLTVNCKAFELTVLTASGDRSFTVPVFVFLAISCIMSSQFKFAISLLATNIPIMLMILVATIFGKYDLNETESSAPSQH